MRQTKLNGLTKKQEKFAINVFNGMSRYDAYCDAYNAVNMQRNTIDVAAAQLLRKPAVAQKIKEMQDTLATRNIVTVEKVIDELSKIAFDDIKNYLEFGSAEIVIGKDVTGSEIIKSFTDVKIKNSADIDTRNIQEIQLDSKGNLKFKLYPKDAALTQLGRYLGIFTDKTEVTGKDGGPIEVDFIRQKIIKQLAKKCNKG
jgi:phage terminase small subunit